MISTSLSILGVFLFTQLCKRWISPKFGDTGVHVLAFIAGLVAVAIKGAMSVYPSFAIFIVTAGQYLVASLALYEIIIKQIKDKTNILG